MTTVVQITAGHKGAVVTTAHEGLPEAQIDVIAPNAGPFFYSIHGEGRISVQEPRSHLAMPPAAPEAPPAEAGG